LPIPMRRPTLPSDSSVILAAAESHMPVTPAGPSPIWQKENDVGQQLVRPNPTWLKWAEWLGQDPKPGTIYKDVLDMRAARRVWEGFQTIVGIAPEEARKYGTFHSWMNGNYIRSQGLAVRRQVEVSDDVVSLGPARQHRHVSKRPLAQVLPRRAAPHDAGDGQRVLRLARRTGNEAYRSRHTRSSPQAAWGRNGEGARQGRQRDRALQREDRGVQRATTTSSSTAGRSRVP